MQRGKRITGMEITGMGDYQNRGGVSRPGRLDEQVQGVGGWVGGGVRPLKLNPQAPSVFTGPQVAYESDVLTGLRVGSPHMGLVAM
jgi:hypothetical protein